MSVINCRIGTRTIDSYCLLFIWLFCSVLVLGGGFTILWGGLFHVLVFLRVASL